MNNCNCLDRPPWSIGGYFYCLYCNRIITNYQAPTLTPLNESEAGIKLGPMCKALIDRRWGDRLALKAWGAGWVYDDDIESWGWRWPYTDLIDYIEESSFVAHYLKTGELPRG